MPSFILAAVAFVETLWRQLATALGWPAPARLDPSDEGRCSAETLENLRTIQAQREQKFALLQRHLPSRALGSPWDLEQQPSQFVTEMAAAFGVASRPPYAATTVQPDADPLERVFQSADERKFYASLPTQIRFVRELAAHLAAGPIRSERDAEARSLLSSLAPFASDPGASLECLRLSYQNLYERWIDRTPSERATLRDQETRAQAVYTETLARYTTIAKETDRASEALVAADRALRDSTRETPQQLQARVGALPDPQPWVQPLKEPTADPMYGAHLHHLQAVRDKTLRKVSAYQQSREALADRVSRDRSRTRARSRARP